MRVIRRNGLRVIAVAVILLCAAAGTAIPAAGKAESGWRQVATPIPPAVYGIGTAAAWDGREFLVFAGGMFHPGGCTDLPCEYPFLRAPHAQAYDPDTATWRRIASPLATVNVASVASSRGVTYVLGHPEPYLVDGPVVIQAYDRMSDSWSSVPLPPNGGGRLLDASGQLVSVGPGGTGAATRDAVYDPGAGTWRELPADPFGRSSTRHAIWTSAGLVLASAVAPVRDDGNVPRYIRLAVLRDLDGGRWERIGGTGLFSGATPHAFGSVLVWPDRDICACGTRKLRSGGTFDLRTGRADLIPDPPGMGGAGVPDGLAVRGGVTLSGFLFDPVSRTWRKLPDAPHAGDAQVEWASGGDVLFRYGGTRRHATPLGNERPVNEAYVLDAGAPTGAGG